MGRKGNRSNSRRDVEWRLGTGCIWETFRKPKNGDKRNGLQKRQRQHFSQPEIPLLPVYINRTDFMRASPPLAKLAELNIAHWQSSSDQRNILHVARVPILFGAGVRRRRQNAIGASEMVKFNSNPAAKLTYVEHTGAAIGAGERIAKPGNADAGHGPAIADRQARRAKRQPAKSATTPRKIRRSP
jgi:hypothetical protein